VALAAATLLAASASAGDKRDDHKDKDKHKKVLEVKEKYSEFDCPSSVACFKVKGKEKLSHVFVDVDFGVCQPNGVPLLTSGADARYGAPFEIYVDGKRIPHDYLRYEGGPCHDIYRKVWFELPYYAKDEALVCVKTPYGVPQKIRVGAKSGYACESDTKYADYCSNCGHNMCAPLPPT
jgi:hypothetical protein